MATRGGLRPTSAQRVVESFEAGGEGPVRGRNPFKADHSQHLQELRQKSGAPGATAAPGPPASRRAKTPPALSQLREREREHLVLQSLERLEHKHTAERAVRDLTEVIENASLEELRKFLRVAFDSKRPLVASKARQQLLLLLRSVVRRFHALNAGSDAAKALKERVLPLLVHALKSAELTGVVVTTLHDILDCHVPEEDPQMAKEGFLQAGKAILQALMDPLALGMGWDSEVKRRCVSTLAAITPELLRRARQCVGGEEASDPQVKELLETYARLLVHCLEVSSDLHEGLLQCLLQLSLEASSGLIPFARELAALCAGHLLETPSAPPAYLQVKEMHRPESPPPKRALSRDLALACCDLLQRLAPLQAAEAAGEKIQWPQLRSQVLQALDRENLNLQRLTRGHEKIRKSIKDARQAWDALPESWPSGTADPDEEQLPKTWNRAMQSVLEMRQMEQMEADACLAASGTPKDGTTPPRRDSGAEPDDDGLALEEIPRRASSSSWYLQEESNQSEAIRLESELPNPAAQAAGPVPRTPPPCGAGRLPETVQAEEKRQAAKVDASTEMPDFGATSSTVDVGTEMTPRPAPTPQRPTKPSKPAFSTEVYPRQRWPRLSPEDCPLLGGILDYLAAGRVDLAMQCIFSVGDEQTLRSVLQRLDSGEVWLQLPSPEAKHLVKLLVALICRDPYSSAAKEACPWLETFLRSPYQALLPSEELPNLQGALFSLSSVGGMLGPMAARIYFHLFQQAKAPQNEQFRGRTFATYA